VRSGLARLKDAENEANSRDSRFDLACSAAHALSLAALRHPGFRPSKRYIVFKCCRTCGRDGSRRGLSTLTFSRMKTSYCSRVPCLVPQPCWITVPLRSDTSKVSDAEVVNAVPLAFSRIVDETLRTPRFENSDDPARSRPDRRAVRQVSQISAAVLPATTEQLALVAALGQRAGTRRFGTPAVLLERASAVPCCRMNSERETPRSRVARESSRSSARASAIVMVFFLESAMERCDPRNCYHVW
jgi:hypothetical protein